MTGIAPSPVSAASRATPLPQYASGKVQRTSPAVADQDLLWWIVESTSGATGEEFFNSLVSRLALALKLKYVLVTECLEFPARRVRTLAYWIGNGLVPNIEYPLEGTPCKETIDGQTVCFFPRDVGKKFPPPGTEPGQVSYYGIPIFDSSRARVIGHFAFLDDKVMEADVFANPLFHLFASRAGAELQRYRAEEDARAHLQQLAHAARAGSMGELAGAIAHEVNQPLAAIISYARACEALLAGHRDLDPDVHTALTAVITEAGRAGGITKRLRGFLSGRESEFSLLRLDHAVREAAAMTQADARKRGIALEFRFARDLPPVLADAVQIEQIIFNLLRNALEAQPQEGAGPRWVTCATEQRPEGAALIVTDNGTGISAAVRERLFHPFVTTKPDGMGIGLSLSRTIAQHAGGTLEHDAAYTSGARFVLTLPAAGDHAEGAA